MPQIIVTSRAGDVRSIDAANGFSLMRAIVDQGAGEILALCGGVMSCATCHVYVDEAFLSRLAPMSPDENEILSGLPCRANNSRLSCQIPLSQELDGLRVTIAPE